MKKLSQYFSFPVFILGIVILVLIYTSGRAQDFVEAGVSGLAILIGLSFNVYLAISCGLYVYNRIVNKNKSLDKERLGLYLVIVVFDVALVLSAWHSAVVIKESMEIGDRILSEIHQYREKNGSCPESLKALFGEDVPVPALKNSLYNYSQEYCSLVFESRSFMACRKGVDDKIWKCDD